MHSRLHEIAQYLDAQRTALLAAAASLPGARWIVRPQSNQWSVSDVFQHLHRVERGSARLIAMKAGEARAAGHPPELEDGSVMGSLDFARITDRSWKVVAPERVAPQGEWTCTATLEAIATSRAELRAAIQAADGLALESVRHDHPRFGEINLYQWILFVGQHEARHVAQVAEIVRTTLGAPVPVKG